MTLTKQHKVIIGVAVAAVAAYLLYRWYKNRQAQAATNSPTGAIGTNLNSVAPELVGGSSGPSVGPAVALPVNITLVEKGGSEMPTAGGNQMIPAPVGTSANPVFRQTGAAMQPSAGGGTDNSTDSDSAAAEEPGTDTSGDDRSGATADTGDDGGG